MQPEGLHGLQESRERVPGRDRTEHMFPSVTRRPNRLLRDLGGSVAASAGTERGLDTNNAPVDQQVCSVTCRALPLEIGRSRGWRVCFIHDLIPSTRIDPSGGVIGRVGSRTHKATSDIQCMWRTRSSGSSTRTCFVSTTNSLAKDHLAGRICVIASTRLQDIRPSSSCDRGARRVRIAD